MQEDINGEKNSARVERYVQPEETTAEILSERVTEQKLRPQSFSDFPGQLRAKENLRIYVNASKTRPQPLDHVLLHGPPGLGKTSLARIIANELDVPYAQTSGPAVEKAGDLAGILAGLNPGSVLFIDEIHRLPIVVEELLYSAMEDFEIDVLIGQGSTARSVKMAVVPFTLIGATTRVALLSSPLISRFGIQERFEFYDDKALSTIIKRSALIEGILVSDDGAVQLAKRSRGTPRIANRLLRRVRDFAQAFKEDTINAARVDFALARMEIDHRGLEPLDRKILETILERYSGGPVGIETLAHTIGEDRGTIEEVYEPFLVHQGLLIRGPRGREVSALGKKHLQEVFERLGQGSDPS